MDFDRNQREYWAKRTNVRSYDHPVVKMFAEQRVAFISELFKDLAPNRGLDVGCGDGFGMSYMRRIVRTIYGCDQSAEMLRANPADKVFLKECNAYDLRFDDSEFDLVYCWELLHHVGDPQQVVNEMARVTNKLVLICEPNCINPAMALFALVKTEERGLLRFTPSYTSTLLMKAGLKKVRRYSVGWFTPNRTPSWVAEWLLKLPYRLPLLGLYTIALGIKE